MNKRLSYGLVNMPIRTFLAKSLILSKSNRPKAICAGLVRAARRGVSGIELRSSGT